MRFLRDLGLLVVVVLGLTAGSQIPSFVDAYAQRLGGAIDELDRQVAAHRAEAAANGLTLEAYLQRHRANADPVIQGSGRRIAAMVGRLAQLAEAQAALSAAGPWSRPVTALTHADGQIMANAYDAWRPGLAIDPRWGGVGAGLAWLLHWCVAALLVRGVREGWRTRRSARGGTS